MQKVNCDPNVVRSGAFSRYGLPPALRPVHRPVSIRGLGARPGKTYTPNGAREVARRLRQADALTRAERKRNAALEAICDFVGVSRRTALPAQRYYGQFFGERPFTRESIGA